MKQKTPTGKKESLVDRLKREMSTKSFDRTSKDAYKWLQKRVTQLSDSKGAIRDQIVKEKTAKRQTLKADPSAIHIGSMICYAYDPKHKQTLPYYDAFPVGFLVGITPRGSWQMINLHYLPPTIRALLFDKLMGIANNQRFDKSTKLKLSYQLLKGASKFALFKPCFKEYLPGHVRSKIIKIPPDEWATVMFLPLAQFKKASASQVWSDSLRGKD